MDHLVIRNVLLKRERNMKEKSSRMKVLSTLSIRSRFIWYLKCSTQKREKYEREVIQNEGFVDTVDTKQVHPVFEMLYSIEREIWKRSHPEWRFCWHCQSRFIQYSKCSTWKREKYERKVIWNEGFVNTVDTKQVHPVFKIYMSLLLIVFTVYVNTVNTYNWITMQILIRRLWITVKFDLNPWFSLNYNRVRINGSN